MRIQKHPSHQFRQMPHILSKHPFLRYISGQFTGAILTFRKFIISIFICLVPNDQKALYEIGSCFFIFFTHRWISVSIFFKSLFQVSLINFSSVVGSKSNVDVGFIINFRSLCQKWLEEESFLELTKQNQVWHINYSPIGFIYLQQMFRTIFLNIFNQLFAFDLKIF